MGVSEAGSDHRALDNLTRIRRRNKKIISVRISATSSIEWCHSELSIR